MTEALLIVLLAAALVMIVLQLVILLRKRQGLAQDSLDRLARRSDELGERLERELRADIALGRKESQEGALAQRAELSASMAEFSKTLQQQMATIAGVQNNQIDSFAQQLAKLVESNEKRLGEVRLTLETKLKELQTDNATRLEEMRKTVDEKLHATLEKRVGESFKQVSDRLEAVHKGLGEMQTLAAGVGDLKRVLTNVKSRGTWGEVQLSALLEQTLTAEQYAKNVATVPGSRDIVEFAIKLPGQDVRSPVWLPIDSKFPVEDYERLLGAEARPWLPAAFGVPDIVINNAGTTHAALALEQTEADWDRVVDTNLKGAFLVAQEAARRLIAAGTHGSIINIASVLGLRQAATVAPYAASKAGLIQLTRELALEWARHSIRVNAIAPGYFLSDLNREYFGTPAGEALVKRVPQRRLGQPADLDGALLLLASDASRFMTGAVLSVDGGHSVSTL